MRLVLIHSFDPRGLKVGGIETHVRQVLRRHPAGMRVLLIGIDDKGDLALGRPVVLRIEGREIDFVPVLHVPAERQTGAATRLLHSTTLRFAFAVCRHIRTLRKLLSGQPASAEIERYEYAPIAWLLRLPLVTVNHAEGNPRTDKMDSLLSRHWYLHYVAERIALTLSARIFGVTTGICDRIAARFPRHAAKTAVLTVSVDTDLFRPSAFDTADGKLRLIYAGRLDEVKNPQLMFDVARRLHEALGGAFEFHYCGSADPHRFAEFDAIKSFTVRHGAIPAAQVAEVMRQAHMGILVSHHEGMPCFLLELLASGRPFVGLRLAQFDQVVKQGISGSMVERAEAQAETEQRIVAAALRQWDEIRRHRMDPQLIHAEILPWSVDSQLGRLFDSHHEIAHSAARAPPSDRLRSKAAR